MKTAIFTWLFLLPIPIYTSSYTPNDAEGSIAVYNYQETPVNELAIRAVGVIRHTESLDTIENYGNLSYSGD